MKRKILLAIAPLFMGFMASSQTWTAQTSGSTAALFDVQFIADTGWTVGGNGTVLKTIDGGQNWNLKPSGQSIILYGVHFINSQEGWACGAGGTVIQTQDGGETWFLNVQGAPVAMYDIFFTGVSNGIAVGDQAIATTSNGGNTWTPNQSLTNINSVYFTSTSTGWICGNSGQLKKTTNGGSAWTDQTSGVGDALNSLFFLDANTGWCAGANGTILKTADGGTTWTPQTTPNNASYSSIYFVSSTHGWVAANGGLIMNTTDGGTTWTTQTTNSSANFTGIHMNSISEGWAVGPVGTILSYSSNVSLAERSETQVVVYPNPANNELNVISDAVITSIEIMDATGKSILNGDQTTIDIEALTSGIYFVNIFTENGMTTKKIVKE